MVKFETQGAVFAFDAHFAVVDEPASAMHEVDVVAAYQAAHSLIKAIYHALFPCLHLGPVEGDGLGRDAHGGQFFLARLPVAFG